MRTVCAVTACASLAVVLAACASGEAEIVSDGPAPAPTWAPIPSGGTGFDDPPSADGGAKPTKDGGSSSSGSSSGQPTSDAGTTTNPPTPPPAPTGTNTGSTGGACGLCDRDWTCNNFTDHWSTVSATCVNDRTGTALKCGGSFDQGGMSNVGTWKGSATKLTLLYPMLGGGTKTVECFP